VGDFFQNGENEMVVKKRAVVEKCRAVIYGSPTF
jgi:hypothetical protein